MDIYEKNGLVTVFLDNDVRNTKGKFALTHEGMLYCQEGPAWLNRTLLDQVSRPASADAYGHLREAIDQERANCVNLRRKRKEQWLREQEAAVTSYAAGGKKKIHLLALGSVGQTVLMGLKLLGGDCISEIGIYDLDQNALVRFEKEMNQTVYPWEYHRLPDIKILEEQELFDCDVFVFCAASAVPPLDAEVKDVRMAQFEANRKIAEKFAKMAAGAGFQGIFAVVSDPVDLLCKVVYLAAGGQEKTDGKGGRGGLMPEQIRGYGLGVMNGRAAYYAKKDQRFKRFLSEGRAYGPHGKGLIIADSAVNYDPVISKELTKLAVEDNQRTRELGFKPYIAPALSSAALSLILTVKGQWHYSSVFLGGVYLGCKNRETLRGTEIEQLPLHEQLYDEIQSTYSQLEAIL